MNAGIAFISRKSRKTDVAWRYAIAVADTYLLPECQLILASYRLAAVLNDLFG